MNTTPTTIVRLEAENFKRLNAVTIKPDGSTVVVGGRNAQGKTSVLDAIETALRGRDAIPGEPVHRGKKKAQIILETQDLIVTRKFRANGDAGTLEVTNKEGAKFPSPQAVLDKLIAAIAFDPLAFITLGKTTAGKRQQLEQLRALVGVDTSKIEAERKRVFDERTIQNRLVAEQQAVVARMPKEGPARVDISGILAQIEDAQATNAALAEARSLAGMARREAGRAIGDLQELEAEAEALEKGLAAMKNDLVTAERLREAQSKVLATIDEELENQNPIDLAPLRKALADAEAHNEKVHETRLKAEQAANDLAGAQHAVKLAAGDVETRKKAIASTAEKIAATKQRAAELDAAATQAENKAAAPAVGIEHLQQAIKDAEAINLKAAEHERRADEVKKLDALERKADALTAQIEDLDIERKTIIEGASLPVAGLGFNEDGVTFNGIALDQASSAEQLRVGLAIACGMNPSLRVMLIRDGSLLDSDSMKLVADMAAKHEAQVWIEKVSDGEGCTVVIEDGSIRNEPESSDQQELAVAD